MKQLNTTLYPHNQKAVDAVRAHFAAGHRKAAVVHATGTGKSYIIAAVAQEYRRVLVIAPNNFVLDETRKVCHEGCEFRTYASVMYSEGDHNAYDLIVLDEFHRGGADKWGIGVSQLIEANPDALLLGTSATDIRYLDNQRNMSDELFDGQVVSRLTLKDAIDQCILPNPTYVSSIYTMDETVRIRKQKIFDSPRKDLDKDALCRRLDGIAHNWENAGGVPAIIRKYFSHDMQRVIVFCSKVARADEARKLLSRWFGLAGFNRVRYYNIDYKEKRLEREMADFQQPLGDYGLKVAISVNMLNEGVHIPHVDGVIMLRSTISRIIIEQQVGRCLTSNNAALIPVVLDLVNNMDMIRYDEPIFTGEFGPGNGDSRKEHKHKGFPFKVIDECRDLRVLLDHLDLDIGIRHYWTYEEVKAIALQYSSKIAWVQNDKKSYSFARNQPYYDEITSHMDELNHRWSYEECAAIASQYTVFKTFKEEQYKVYKAIETNGWQDLCAHMQKRRWNYTDDELREIALKYKTFTEFNKNDESACRAARKRGEDFFNSICAHMPKKKTFHHWTDDELIRIASKYVRLNDFLSNEKAAATAARRKGNDFFKRITSHMQVGINQHKDKAQ